MKGSVLLYFDEILNFYELPVVQLIIGTETREYQWSEVQKLYSTYIESGNTLSVSVSEPGFGEYPSINVYLQEYTNDDTNGDNGIKTSFITGVTGNNINLNTSISNIPINPSPNCYDFNVIIKIFLYQGCAPIGILSGTGGSEIFASAVEVKLKNIGTQQQNVNNLYIGTQSNHTTRTYSGSTASSTIGPVFRVLPNYAIDTTFNSSAALGNYRSIGDIEIQNDGKILCGGFENTSNTTGYCLNRLTTLGALDGTFTRYVFSGSTGLYPFVDSVVQQSDGKIIVAGYFERIGGTQYYNYARFNYDGTIDTTYYAGGSNTGFNLPVGCEIDLNDKTYFFGGAGTTFNGQTFGGLLRLRNNGQLDTTFNGTGKAGFSLTTGSSTVNSVLPLSDGKILCTGTFNRYNGVACPNGIVRLNANGTLDTTFNTGGAGLITNSGIFVTQPTEVIEDPYGAGLVYHILYNVTSTGATTTYNGQTIPKDILSINSDGLFVGYPSIGFNGTVSNPISIKTLPNSMNFVVGNFNRYDNTVISNGGMIQLGFGLTLQNC